MENIENPPDLTDKETDDEEKIEKPKKVRPPATEKQIEARKKNFEKMLKKRTEESLALAQKKVEDKLKKKEERKLAKTGNDPIPEPPQETPQETPKLDNKKYGVVGERRVPYEEYDIIEEHITKKPKKKRIIYKEESDSEEEVIIRRKKPENKPEINDNQYGVGGERRVPAEDPFNNKITYAKNLSRVIKFF